MRARFFHLGLSALALSAAAVTLAADPAEKKITLGKLGQTVKSASIFQSASTRSRVYYRLKPYEYIVVNPSRASSYYAVLLRNGQQGYIRKEAVAELPYDVTTTQKATDTALTPATRDAGSVSSRGMAAQYGTKFTGTPYRWGGNDPLKGIDCSAFVKFLYGKIGINLPRTASEQALVGQPITQLEDLQPGDRLYFWEKRRGKIGHTGLYLGNGYFVHSSSGKGGVSTDYLSENWRKILVAARR